MTTHITLTADQVVLVRELLGTEINYSDSVEFVVEVSRYVGRVKFLLGKIDAEINKAALI
jgi:hypothetical protein